ncbi:MAG: hypothetical protein ABI809_00940 [Caldimonas sp.]
MSDQFDAFLASAWDEHADRPEAVADRLAASLRLVQHPSQVPRYAALLTHVYGEHLGDWPGGVASLRSLGELPAAGASADAANAVARNIAALRHVAGEPLDDAALAPDGRIAALATAASICAGRQAHAQALAAYARALRDAEAGLPAGSPALRALAVGGNNLAAALEEKTDRDPHETAGMVEAARSALKYWTLAGTWLEVERAEYRLARSLLEAGDAAAAIGAAQRCIDGCARHDAPPFERFFGAAALALAQRAAGDRAAFEAARDSARACFEQVPADEQPACGADLQELAD